MTQMKVEDVEKALKDNKQSALGLLPEGISVVPEESEVLNRMLPYITDKAMYGTARLVLAAMGKDPDVLLPLQPETIEFSDRIVESAAYHLTGDDGKKVDVIILSLGTDTEPGTIAFTDAGEFVQMSTTATSIEVITDETRLKELADMYTEKHNAMMSGFEESKKKVTIV